MTIHEDPIESETTAAKTSLEYLDNLHSCACHTSPPLILRSYISAQSPNTLLIRQQQKYNDEDDNKYLIDSVNKHTNNMKLSIDYILHYIEQNEQRYEEQEHNRNIEQEWQILGRVVDRLLVYIFIISSMLVFLLIFFQAPHLRLK